MREYCGFRSWLDHVREFSRGLIKQSLDQGDGNDIMSVLLRANASSRPKNKMHDSELVDQIVFVTSTNWWTHGALLNSISNTAHFLRLAMIPLPRL